MRPQEVYETYMPVKQSPDEMQFHITPNDNELILYFTCGRCNRPLVCVGLCLDYERFKWYTGPHQIRYKDGLYICPKC